VTPAMGEVQIRTLCRIAEAAAAEVMAVYAGDFAAWSKDDASPLTHADLRSDAVIRRGLETSFPGIFILSEESTSADLEEREAFFLVDPLDGTREFIGRNGEFTVNIALVEHGVPVAGVVLAPALNELFFGVRGHGAWKHDGAGTRSVRVAAPAPGEPLRVIGSRSHGGAALSAWLARLDCSYRFVAAGSSLKFCRIAEGEADVYPRIGPTSQWDTAAGQAVLEAAGGAVLDAQGQPLGYGLKRPTLNPDFLAVADTGLSLPPLGP
jgi:3'(2'), 5'-bisphosphate nucleotidase